MSERIRKDEGERGEGRGDKGEMRDERGEGGVRLRRCGFSMFQERGPRHYITPTSPSHHLTISPPHHLTTSPPHHLTTSPPHHLTTSPNTSPHNHIAILLTVESTATPERKGIEEEGGTDEGGEQRGDSYMFR